MVIDNFYKRNFRFQANRYEEWQGGQCISEGGLSCGISGTVHNNVIHFILSDKGNLRIPSSFSFELVGSQILGDRIQYVHATSDFNPVIPMVCHLFVKNGTISCVRFAMTNPDRLIEFYGKLVELDQPVQVDADSVESIPKAEHILSELSSYGMMNTEAIMERAVELYNDHANVRNLTDAKCIVEALKLFVKCNQLHDKENDGQVSMLKPKILMFIALCNYKIDNTNRAYHIAQKALTAIDDAETNSPFIGIPKSMLGEDAINELLDAIKQNHWDKVDQDQDDDDVDENEVDTTVFDNLARSYSHNTATSKDNIKSLVQALSHIQKQFSEIGNKTGDVELAFQNNQVIVMYKNVLYFAWEKYKYGWHSDFWKEGDSMVNYMMFELQAREIINDLNKVLKESSPFRMIERNGAITKDLIVIFEDLLSKIDKGSITI